MERRPYPTSSDGMPISPSELNLRPSRLRNIRANKSLHHLHFDAPRYHELLITDTVRDLQGEHLLMQNDQHNIGRFALHTLYSAPKMATLRQYMDRLDQAHETGEKIERRVRGFGYVALDITPVHWKQLQLEYNRLRGE